MKSLRTSKLVSLLATFDEGRMSRFQLYVHSPYFNTSKTISACYDAIASFYPSFESDDLSLESLHAQVFDAEKEYDYHRISNVMSDLYELCLNFLVQVSLETNAMERWLVLPRLRQARLDKQFEQQLKKYEKLLDAQSSDEFSHIYRNYVLNELIWYSSSHEPEKRFDYLQEQYESILSFLLVRLGRLATLLTFEEYQTNTKFRLPFVEELEHFFLEAEVPDDPLVQVYQRAYLMIRFHRDEDYHTLRALRAKYDGFLSGSDLGFTDIFLNHHVVWVNYEQGRTDLYPFMVQDQKIILDRGVYRRQRSMPFSDYVLYVRSACIARDFEWVERLEREFLPLVVEDERENCRNFAAAVVARTNDKKREALMYLQQVNFRLPVLAIQVKGTSLMLSFELAEYESCLHGIDSFRHYLKSLKSLPPLYIIAHQDLLKHLKRLISISAKARSKQRTLDLQELRAEIQTMRYNTFNVRSWLTNQCDALLG